MVIQRWQSVLLLLAAIAMAFFCTCPIVGIYGDDAMHQLSVSDIPAYLVFNITVTVLLLVDIFLYGNLRLQMRVAAISAILSAASAAVGILIICLNMPQAQPATAWALSLPTAAFIITLIARRYMRRDYKLLNSYDRLR